MLNYAAGGAGEISLKAEFPIARNRSLFGMHQFFLKQGRAASDWRGLSLTLCTDVAINKPQSQSKVADSPPGARKGAGQHFSGVGGDQRDPGGALGQLFPSLSCKEMSGSHPDAPQTQQSCRAPHGKAPDPEIPHTRGSFYLRAFGRMPGSMQGSPSRPAQFRPWIGEEQKPEFLTL